MMLIRIFNRTHKVITIKCVKIVDAKILSVRRFRVCSDEYVFVSAFKCQEEWQRKCILIFILLLPHHICGLVVRVPGYRSRGPGLDSRRHQIFCEVVGLELGPLSLVRLVSTTEELLGRNISGSGLENREYGRVDPLR
jgi:hypothetical protein